MVKYKLKLPIEYSEELAEETGIHIGDGFMNIYPKYNNNTFSYSADALNDVAYSQFVRGLIKKLYNIYPSCTSIRKNTIEMRYHRKPLILFKQKLGLPLGPKTDIQIPAWILSDERFIIAGIRGLFDTDGYLRFRKPYKGKYHSYPELRLTSKSKPLIQQVAKLLGEFKLSAPFNEEKESKTHPNKTWTLSLNGVKTVERYLRLIGLRNEKHLLKHRIWKKFGFCPAKLTREQKQFILAGKLDPCDIKNGGAEI
jgi:intein/homing endonuclease